MVRFLKVEGNSLLPRYREGDYVLVASTPFPSGRIKPGDVVAFRHPAHGTLIKLVESVTEGGYHVVGTHPHSVDSRQFGPVRREDLIGKVLWHISQPAARPKREPSSREPTTPSNRHRSPDRLTATRR